MVHNHDNQSISPSCLEDEMIMLNLPKETLSTVSSRDNEYNEQSDFAQAILVEVDKNSEPSSNLKDLLENESKISASSECGDTFRFVINQSRMSNFLAKINSNNMKFRILTTANLFCYFRSHPSKDVSSSGSKTKTSSTALRSNSQEQSSAEQNYLNQVNITRNVKLIKLNGLQIDTYFFKLTQSRYRDP